jgi:hypothetical protein
VTLRLRNQQLSSRTLMIFVLMDGVAIKSHRTSYFQDTRHRIFIDIKNADCSIKIRRLFYSATIVMKYAYVLSRLGSTRKQSACVKVMLGCHHAPTLPMHTIRSFIPSAEIYSLKAPGTLAVSDEIDCLQMQADD